MTYNVTIEAQPAGDKLRRLEIQIDNTSGDMLPPALMDMAGELVQTVAKHTAQVRRTRSVWTFSVHASGYCIGSGSAGADYVPGKD